MAHWSNCAINNGPALPVGPCDCGNNAPTADIIQFIPRANPKRELSTLEVAALEIINQITEPKDTTPSEYVAPSEDSA